MKKLIAVIVILLAAMVLTACRGTEHNAVDPTESNMPAASEKPTEQAALPTMRPYTYDPKTDFDNRYNCPFTSIVELDNMFVWHDACDGPFFFYDKETGYSGILCNKPECDHKSEGCNGLSMAETVVSYYEGKLYWLFPWPSEGSYKIYRMNTDSSDIELFMTIPFEDEETAQYQRMFVHRGKIYLMNRYKTVVDAVPETWYRVSVCDLKTHDGSKLKTVFELKDPGLFTDRMFFGGDDVYLLACCYHDKDFRLRIYRYDTLNDITDVVVDIPVNEDDFYAASYYITPEGEIFIGEGIFDHYKDIKVYKVNKNKLVPFMDFSDGVINWSSIMVEEEVFIALGAVSTDPYEYVAWLKDHKHNTLFKGELTAHYRDDLPGDFVCDGVNYFGAARDRILAVFTEKNQNPTDGHRFAVVFVEYDITENGLEEKTLAYYYY